MCGVSDPRATGGLRRRRYPAGPRAPATGGARRVAVARQPDRHCRPAGRGELAGPPGVRSLEPAHSRRRVTPPARRRRRGPSRDHRASGYRLVVDRGELDASVFEELCERGEAAQRAGASRNALDCYLQARDLWRGPPLEGVPLGLALQGDLARLGERRLTLEEQCASLRSTLGEHERAIADLRDLLVAHPLREPLWAALLHALYRMGRQADALAGYQEARHRLVDELGIEPGPELQRLEQRILAQDPSLAACGAAERDARAAAARGRTADTGAARAGRRPPATQRPKAAPSSRWFARVTLSRARFGHRQCTRRYVFYFAYDLIGLMTTRARRENRTMAEAILAQPIDTTATPDLVDRARRLRPLLDEHAEASERLGELTGEIDAALHDAWLYGMWVPRSLGGAELDPVSSLRVVEALAYGQPSAAWVHMAAALAIGTAGSYLGDEAVDELFSGDRFPVIAGQGTRPGSARPRDGGHDISGSWSFASGIKHSTYIHTAVVTEDTGEFRICVVPLGQATLIDNWDVLGLVATGSIDYTMDDVFVPEAWSHEGLIEESPRGGDLYRLGIIHLALIGHSGWALGTGRRILDELAAMARTKAGRPGQLADSETFHIGFADVEGKFRAASAFVFEAWHDAWDTLTAGSWLSVRQRTLLRIALTNATWTAHEVAQFAYRNGGTTALRSGTMQRLFRDMHAGTQHITSANGVLRAAGQELAGLAPGKEWVFLGLEDIG
ncbi:MAG: hypothetical protein GEV09_18065 [Pseudonocardiaceae bacterium]|nr:hypothetical protein [Pseudonocardiaceae bacterium]